MRFDIITIFPKIFEGYFNESIIARAQKKKLTKIKIWDLRKFSKNKHKKVDDKPYGGGAGMVLQAEPILKAVKAIGRKPRSKIVLFSAAGKQFTREMAGDWAIKYKNMILISGRYEGIDERVVKILGAEKISIGPYVLTGGELPAMVVTDAVLRHLAGVLGKMESLEEKRFGVGVPAYTRPEVVAWKNKKYAVPAVLLSGDHKKIREWRRKNRKAG